MICTKPTCTISEFWRSLGSTRPHVNPDEIIRTSHGCIKFDETSIRDAFGHHAKAIPGAAELWLKLLTIEKPDVFITAEKFTKGKPHPMSYQAARYRLDYKDASKKVIVFEDAPAGIAAGKGIGAIIVRASGADIFVDDLSSFRIRDYDAKTDKFTLEVGDYHYASDEFLQVN
ncbi:hypothetical protein METBISCDRAFT_30080 [Metschnikowia bicuspidata]|uniref:HAD-like protein n=1 Tax=Metschnikowia bicuspidata TaxID=27322 RepID=A0A4P9ZF24_9ASCO|nr:hypothetical protein METBISCDRAFT_30080 [Metschnikowia bicuspidata]